MQNLAAQILEEFADVAFSAARRDYDAHYTVYSPAARTRILTCHHDPDFRERVARAVSALSRVTVRELSALLCLARTPSTRAEVSSALKALGWHRMRYGASRRQAYAVVWFAPHEATVTPDTVLAALAGALRVTTAALCSAIGVSVTLGNQRRVGRVLRDLGWSRTYQGSEHARTAVWRRRGK